MAVDKKFIRSQIARFVDMPQFPGETGLAELQRAFELTCDSEAQVVAVGNHLLATSRFCPVPANVHEAAEIISQRCAHQHAPTPYDVRPEDRRRYETYEMSGVIGEDITPEYVTRWHEIAKRQAVTRGEKAKQSVARAMLDIYYRKHPGAQR